MKLTCVGLGSARCQVLTLRRTHLLLDCGLWPASAILAWLHANAAGRALQQHVGPVEGPSNPGLLGPCLQMLGCFRLEAALLTTAESILAIPYLMARYPGQQLIQGPIYATIAALDAAQHLAAELAQGSNSHQHATSIAEPVEPPVAIGTAPAAGSNPSAAGTSASQQQQSHAAGRAGHVTTADQCCVAGRRTAIEAAGVLIGGNDAQQVGLACWQDIAPLMDTEWVENCLNKIKAVRYGQAVPLDGVDLTARAFPTGASMGAALWIITDGCRSIGYMSDWRLPFTPGTCLELDPQTLSHLDVLITAPCCLQPAATSTQPPQLTKSAQGSFQGQAPGTSTCVQPPMAVSQMQHMSPQQALHEHTLVLQQLQQAVLSAVMQGGSVLIPLPANGVAWSMLEDIAYMLQSCQLAGQVPLVYISPVASDSLALAASSMEFLSRAHQARPPGVTLPFAQLQATRQLVVGSSLSDVHVQQALQRPCVVLAPVASLAGRDAYQLLSNWCTSKPASSCILTRAIGCDPTAMSEALQVALPQLSHSSVAFIHLDLGGPPPASHLMSLLSQLHSDMPQLVMSEEDTQQLQPWLQASRSSSVCHPYAWLDRVAIKLRKFSRHVEVDPQLLRRLQWAQLEGDQLPPSQHTAGTSNYVAAQLRGLLTFHEGRWRLDATPPLSSPPAAQAIAATALAASVLHEDSNTEKHRRLV